MRPTTPLDDRAEPLRRRRTRRDLAHRAVRITCRAPTSARGAARPAVSPAPALAARLRSAAWTSTSSSSAPRRARRPQRGRPTALLMRRGGERLLFDCGEGTQRQLMRSTLGLPDLEEIFLTHFHADHYLGLPGMLKTFALRQRERAADRLRPARPPRALRRACGGSSAGSRTRSSSSRCAPVRRSSGTATACSSFPSHHGVSAVGYALDEDDRPGRFDVEAADALGVPPGPERGALQRGESVTLDDGQVITPDAVLGPARTGRRDRARRRHGADRRGPGARRGRGRARARGDVRRGGARPSARDAAFDGETGGRDRGRRGCPAARADAPLRALLRPRAAREAREVFPQTVVPRDFDVIEVPFAERGEPELVKRGARPPRGRAVSDIS